LKREFRLRQKKDIQRLRSDGRAQSNRLVVILTAPQEAAADGIPQASRVGVITGKRLGKAVTRNKVRRRLKAVMQQVHCRLPVGWDFLLLARKPIVDASYQDIETAVLTLLRRAGFLEGNDVQPR
jgi:ribonuclease P protein component